MRSPNGTFPEYHTSVDNLQFVTPTALEKSLSILVKATDVLEWDETYPRVHARGKPHLDRRRLHKAISGQDQAAAQVALLWVLNLADGRHSLLDMTERSELGFAHVAAAAKVVGANLIRRTPQSGAEKRASTLPGRP